MYATVLSVLLVAAMFGADAGTQFAHAVAMRGCTQEDIPALEVYLTPSAYDGRQQPPKPHIRIEIERAEWDQLVGKDLELAPLSRQGLQRQVLARAELNAEEGPPIWLQGKVRLQTVKLDELVEGSYEFHGPKGEWKGSFRARWLRRTPACG
jgi:hypothetical protein